MDNSVEPAAQPCGGMWVGDPKSCPEWKAVHQQTTLVKTVADQAEVAFGEHPLYKGDDFGDAEHHWTAIRAWMNDRPNALFTPPEAVVDAMMLTEGRNREEIVRCSSGRRLSGQLGSLPRPIGQACGGTCMKWERCRAWSPPWKTQSNGVVLRCCGSRPRTRQVPLMLRLDLKMGGLSLTWHKITGSRWTPRRSSFTGPRDLRCGVS